MGGRAFLHGLLKTGYSVIVNKVLQNPESMSGVQCSMPNLPESLCSQNLAQAPQDLSSLGISSPWQVEERPHLDRIRDFRITAASSRLRSG